MSDYELAEYLFDSADRQLAASRTARRDCDDVAAQRWRSAADETRRQAEAALSRFLAPKHAGRLAS